MGMPMGRDISPKPDKGYFPHIGEYSPHCSDPQVKTSRKAYRHAASCRINWCIFCAHCFVHCATKVCMSPVLRVHVLTHFPCSYQRECGTSKTSLPCIPTALRIVISYLVIRGVIRTQNRGLQGPIFGLCTRPLASAL